MTLWDWGIWGRVTWSADDPYETVSHVVRGCLRGAQGDLFLGMQPTSPETRENHTLFGETRFLQGVGEGQREEIARCGGVGGASGFIRTISWCPPLILGFRKSPGQVGSPEI